MDVKREKQGQNTAQSEPKSVSPNRQVFNFIMEASTESRHFSSRVNTHAFCRKQRYHKPSSCSFSASEQKSINMS
jgi:hypothetical protein